MSGGTPPLTGQPKSNSVLEKLRALGCKRGAGWETGSKPEEQVDTGLEIASGWG